MGLDKRSLRADGVADLYRSALFLARGSSDLGLEFLGRAREKLGKSLRREVRRDQTDNKQERLILAEKILDEYLRLKSGTD